MNSLKKIIAFFFFIFVTGVFITVSSVNKTLRKESTTQETVEISIDSLKRYDITEKRV